MSLLVLCDDDDPYHAIPSEERIALAATAAAVSSPVFSAPMCCQRRCLLAIPWQGLCVCVYMCVYVCVCVCKCVCVVYSVYVCTCMPTWHQQHTSTHSVTTAVATAAPVAEHYERSSVLMQLLTAFVFHID